MPRGFYLYVLHSCSVAVLDMVAVSVLQFVLQLSLAVRPSFSLPLSLAAVYWLTSASAVWLCELHVGNTKGSHWLTSLRRRKGSLAGSPSPQRHRVNVLCVRECMFFYFLHMFMRTVHLCLGNCFCLHVPCLWFCFFLFSFVFACPLSFVSAS